MMEREIELYEQFPELCEKFERICPKWAKEAMIDVFKKAKREGWEEVSVRNQLVFIRREAVLNELVIGKYAKLEFRGIE